MAAPFFTVLGGFLSTFNDNICYSEVLNVVSENSFIYAKSGDAQSLEAWGEKIKTLPLYGYETNCQAVKKALEDINVGKNKKP